MYPFFVDIYINGLPVNYSVSYENEKFVFEPIFNPHYDLVSSSFYLVKKKSGWEMYEEDMSIKSQAIEILEVYLRK